MVRILLISALALIGCSGGGDDVKKDDKDPKSVGTNVMWIEISPVSVNVDGTTFALSSGDTLDRTPIEHAIAQAGERDVKIKTDADVAFGLVAFIADAAVSSATHVDLSVGTRAPVKLIKTPGDEFEEPYLIVTVKRTKPIAAQCPDPCNPEYVMVGHQADAMIGSVWSRSSTLTASRYKWWLVADYGDMWKEQLKAQKPALAKCVHAAKAEHGFGDVEVTVRFQISRGGTIDLVRFDNADTQYQPLYACVETAVKAIKMPQMAETWVKYDYFFGGKSEEKGDVK